MVVVGVVVVVGDGDGWVGKQAGRHHGEQAGRQARWYGHNECSERVGWRACVCARVRASILFT